MLCPVNWSLKLPIVAQLYFTVILIPLPPLLAKSTTGIVVDDLLLVLPGKRPRRRLEVQTFLVTFVVVGTATGRLELVVLVLELRELLLLDATSAAAAVSSTTTDATTFKLCLDANFERKNYTMSGM